MNKIIRSRKNTSGPGRAATAAAVTLLVMGVPSVGSAAETHTVLLSGVDDARGPGLGTGYTFRNVQLQSGAYLVPGQPGAVAFQSELRFNGVAAGSGEFFHNGSTNAVVLRTGQQAPGFAPGVLVSQLDDKPTAASNGNFKTNIVLSGTGVTSNNDRALVVYNNGVASITREGDQVGGLPAGAFYSRFEDVGSRTFGTRGAIFEATLFGPAVTSSNNVAVVVGSPGSFQAIAREGDQISGLPTGAVYSANGSEFSGFANGADGTLIRGRAVVGTVPDANRDVLHVYRNGASTLLAQQGVTSPSNRPGAVITGNLFGIQPSASGKFLLGSELTQGGAVRPALILGDNDGGFKVVADTETPLPGTGSNLATLRNYSIHANGRYAVFTAASGSTNGIFRYDALTDEITKIAVDTDSNLAGGTFGFLRDVPVHVNSSGTVVFTPTTNSSASIYAFDDSNGLSILLNGSIDVDNSPALDVRQLTNIQLVDVGQGNPPVILSSDGSLQFGDEGVLAFTAGFSDGSTGLFTVTVPEPTALAILPLAGIALLRRKRIVQRGN